MHPTKPAYNRDTPARRNAVSSGTGLLRRAMIAANRHRRRRRMMATLEALDDRILRDIGIYRSEIPRVVVEFSDRELGMTPVADSRNRRPTGGSGYAQAA